MQDIIQQVQGQVTQVTKALFSEIGEGPMQACDLLKEWRLHPEKYRKKAIVEGLAHVGELMFFAGPSKVRKTWAAMELAIQAAAGGDWLGFQCNKSKVLYFFLENHNDDIGGRLNLMEGIRGEIPENFYFENLRAVRMDGEVGILDIIAERCSRIHPEVLIIDGPLHIMLGYNENDNTSIYKYAQRMIKFAEAMGAMVAIPVHFAKGDPFAKSYKDRISGASSFTRGCDVQLSMTPVPDSDLTVMDVTSRRPDVAQRMLQWGSDFRFHYREDLNPVDYIPQPKVSKSALKAKRHIDADEPEKRTRATVDQIADKCMTYFSKDASYRVKDLVKIISRKRIEEGEKCGEGAALNVWKSMRNRTFEETEPDSGYWRICEEKPF